MVYKGYMNWEISSGLAHLKGHWGITKLEVVINNVLRYIWYISTLKEKYFWGHLLKNDHIWYIKILKPQLSACKSPETSPSPLKMLKIKPDPWDMLSLGEVRVISKIIRGQQNLDHT